MAWEFQCPQKCCLCLEQSGASPLKQLLRSFLLQKRIMFLCLYCQQFLLICFLFGQPMVSDRGGHGASAFPLCFSGKTGQGKKQWKPQQCLCVFLLLCKLCAYVVHPALSCRTWAALCSPFCFCSVYFWHWFTLHSGNTGDCWNGRLHNSGFL